MGVMHCYGNRATLQALWIRTYVTCVNDFLFKLLQAVEMELLKRLETHPELPPLHAVGCCIFI